MARRFVRGRPLEKNPRPIAAGISVQQLPGHENEHSPVIVQSARQMLLAGARMFISKHDAEKHQERQQRFRDIVIADCEFELPVKVMSQTRWARLRERLGRSFRRQSVRVTEVVAQPVAKPRQFREYLGDHFDTVVRKVEIVPGAIEDEEVQGQLLGVLEEQFPEVYDQVIRLPYKAEALDRLIKNGRLPEVPEEILDQPEVSYRVDFDIETVEPE